jgi:hypothetical protein
VENVTRPGFGSGSGFLVLGLGLGLVVLSFEKDFYILMEEPSREVNY